MRYTKFIALLATMFVAVSCVTNDLDFDDSYTDTASDVVTVYGNIARFADCEVSTRANKTPEESYVSRMALAVFPITNEETGETGDCIHYELRDGSNLLYTVDRAEIRKNYPDDDGGCKYDNQPCVMYIFANMSGLPTTYTGSAAGLLNLALANPGLIRPDDGFPMIGSLGDKDRDGKEFVLIPMSGNRMDLPTVDGTPTDYLNIPMNAIFAKISFEIAVSPDQDIDVHAPARFEMTGYEVHNLPSSVSFNEGNNMEAEQNVNGEAISVAMSGIAQGGNEGSGSTIDFDFYLPERLLTPQTNPKDYGYPLGENGAIVGYDNIPEGNKKYAQRYKPKLLGDQKATFVRIKGKYRDHQEHYHDVSYDIYLGADNYGDFNIKRNNQYYNKLNIKGITSSDDQAENPNAISIDWRVNVERSSPLIISLRRETQLDSHYEVRPLRLRIAGDQVPDGAKVTVEVLNADEKDWIRLEASGTDDTYITSGVSAGKRKYFTTDLMGKLSTTVTVADFQPKVNSTVWIYVDEADVSEATTTRTTRSATIRVTYEDNGKYKEEPFVKDYTLNQYNLHEIKTDNNTYYYIECFEEYLYNYDAEDSYGQTKQEGMPWGLNDVQLSHDHLSFSINESNTDWNNYIATKPYVLLYDFYTTQDLELMENAGFVDPENVDAYHKFAGQHFTEEIYDATKGNTEVDKKVNVLTMADQPRGAVEYCYNRNKRNSDGSVAKVEWYLPAADELEDFIVEAYNYYEEFQENFYWASQPAYIRNIFYYELKERYALVLERTVDAYSFKVYEDNRKYARATKVNNDLKPVRSGLKDKPDIERTDIPWGGNIHEVLGYFYEWHPWKKPARGNADTTTIKKSNESAAVYDEYVDRSKKKRYAAYLGHLYDLIQKTEDGEHGYHERTRNNRVRCVYKKKAD